MACIFCILSLTWCSLLLWSRGIDKMFTAQLLSAVTAVRAAPLPSLVFSRQARDSTWVLFVLSREESKMTDEGKLLKMEVDYSSTVDEKLPEAEKLAKVCILRYKSTITIYKSDNYSLNLAGVLQVITSRLSPTNNEYWGSTRVDFVSKCWLLTLILLMELAGWENRRRNRCVISPGKAD